MINVIRLAVQYQAIINTHEKYIIIYKVILIKDSFYALYSL